MFRTNRITALSHTTGSRRREFPSMLFTFLMYYWKFSLPFVSLVYKSDPSIFGTNSLVDRVCTAKRKSESRLDMFILIIFYTENYVCGPKKPSRCTTWNVHGLVDMIFFVKRNETGFIWTILDRQPVRLAGSRRNTVGWFVWEKNTVPAENVRSFMTSHSQTTGCKK